MPPTPGRARNPLGRAVTARFDPFWAVTKHADVTAVSRDNELFHNADRDAKTGLPDYLGTTNFRNYKSALNGIGCI